MKSAVFEGLPVKPFKRSGFWRHYMTIIVLSDGTMKTTTCVGMNPKPLLDALRGAAFYAHGTWELCTDPNCRLHCDGNDLDCAAYAVGFPAPRPEILAALRGDNQPELAV